MTPQSVHVLRPGDVLFDMHSNIGGYQFGYDYPKCSSTTQPLNIREPHLELHRIRISAPDGEEFIQNLIQNRTGKRYQYLNKCLVVVDWPERTTDNKYIIIVKAAWSYDGQSLGLMTIEVDVS